MNQEHGNLSAAPSSHADFGHLNGSIRGLCPRCGAFAVVHDDTEGVFVCNECGRIVQDSELVAERDSTVAARQFTGVHVHARDTGVEAAAKGLRPSIRRRMIDSKSKRLAVYRILLSRYAHQLSLPSTVLEQANVILEQLIDKDMTIRPREVYAAVCLYTASRNHGIPLTLLDFEGATGVDLFAVGRYYYDVIKTVDMMPTPVEIDVFLSRALEKVMKGNIVSQDLRTDAKNVAEWIQTHIHTSLHPMMLVAVAIMLTLDMNNISVGTHYVAETINVNPNNLSAKLGLVRSKLYEIGLKLPFATSLTPENVVSFTRTIIHMSNALDKHENQSKNETESIAEKDHSTLAARNDHTSKIKTYEDRDRSMPHSKQHQSRNAKNAGQEEALDLTENDDLDDAELDKYLRSEEEVSLYKTLYEISMREHDKY